MPGHFDDVLRAFIAFVVLPNLFFWVVRQFYYLDRPVINHDYAVLGVLWFWLPVWVRITTFAIAFIADVIISTGSMYNINPVAGVVALFRAPVGLIITVVLVFALSCTIAAGLGALLNRFTRRSTSARTGLAIMLGIVVASVLGLPLRSATAKLTVDIVERDRGYRTTPPRMAAATDSLRASLANQNENVALVVVESWAVLENDTAHGELLALFNTAELRRRYHIRTGMIRFRGGTTSGELRELCGVFTDYLVLNDHTIENCLPRQLKRHGYTSTALHGYKREYYSRHRWYPKLFDRLIFEDSLSGSRCGTQFRGICDRDVFGTFKREVQRRDAGRRFVYWLTIDAHTPVDLDRRGELPPDLRGGSKCGPVDFCLVVYFWRETLSRIAQLAADPNTPRTRFIIVGDHAPAFARQSRAGRLISGYVPFVELIPRSPTSTRLAPE